MTRTGPGVLFIVIAALTGILCCRPALAANPSPDEAAPPATVDLDCTRTRRRQKNEPKRLCPWLKPLWMNAGCAGSSDLGTRA
jgi:hypothetical protein